MAYVLEYVEATLKKGGMGTLLIKDHLYLHDYMVKWGPLCQMNSGPNESHHKTMVKAPSKNTQRRLDMFIKQMAQRYTELRLLRKVCFDFGLSEVLQLADIPPPSFINSGVSGSRYSVGFSNINVPTMRWDSRTHQYQTAIHPSVLRLLCEVVLPHLPKLGSKGHLVPCFTEHRRMDGPRGINFRAHPCFRSKENHPKDVWYDWALCDFGENRVVEELPCQILCLMDLSSLPVGLTFAYRRYGIWEPGLYAVVRKFKALPEYSRLTPDNQDGVGDLVGWGELEDGLFVLHCDTIRDTACVVPNLPCIHWDESQGSKKRDRQEMELQDSVEPVGGYFLVKPRSFWAEWFTESVINP
jgi:hypothetical protein